MSDDDLIDPSSIVVPKVDASALEAAAADIRKQGGRIAGSGQDIKSAWSELDSCYSAPEAETLLSAMDPVVEKGDDVESDLDEVATALETFAETARDLKAKIDVAKQDAQNFVDSVKGDDSWDDASGLFGETSDKVEEHNALLDRVATLVHRYQEAERECANKITSLFDGGPTFVGADPQGGTEPGKGETLYGTEEPLTDGPNPWGKPQGSDFPWWVDWGVGEYGTKLGMLQDAGAQTGFYTEDGWGVDSTSEWAGNVWTDWADSVAGTGAMVGVWNPETGTWTQDGQKLDVAQTAWKNAAHEFFPWTELEERPGYVFGTAGTNVGFTVAGIALSATGVGVVVGAPLAASRLAKALGGAGRGEGHFSVDGGTNADSDGGGSGQDGGGSRRPGAGPDGNSGDKEAPLSDIEPGDGFDLSGIGDMNESLDNLADAQRPSTPRWTPRSEPDPAPDAGPAPDASPRPDAPEADQAPPESGRPAEADTPDRQNAPEHPGGADEPDPTTEEVDESFAEIARRHEGLGDAMDNADGGRMAELDGEDPWTIEALEGAEGDTGRGGPGGPDEGGRVPVTPDGMELSHKPGEGDDGPDGSRFGDAVPNGDGESGGGQTAPGSGYKTRLGGSEGSFGHDGPYEDAHGAEPPSEDDRPRPSPVEDPPLEDTHVPHGEERSRGFVGGHTGNIHRVGWMDENGYYYDDRGNVYVQEPDSVDALRAYQEIRDTEGDTAAISENTGIDQTVLDRVKEHLFLREHAVATDPGKHRVGLFSPTHDIASQWTAATEGPLSGRALYKFRRLMMHEGVESALMERGVPYRSTHPDYYNDSQYPNAGPRHFGAHDVAPGEHGNMWAVTDRIGIRRPGFEVEQDLSNLDRLIDHVLGEIDHE